jgi:hypothetical protein
MESLPEELSPAIIVIGAEHCTIDNVRIETTEQLAELGLACWIAGELDLMPADKKLLPSLLNCEPTELPLKRAA